MEAPAAMSDEGQIFRARITRGVVGFLAFAVILRLARALQNYPMWCDETMLAVNLLDRDWTELAQPLAYRQVCPLGFLALEWLVVRIFGFSELSLRLIPLVSALASVPLFYLLARRILGQGTSATFLAVAIFAVSQPLIRYAAEAKPYAVDFLVSLVLLNLAVRWLRAPGRAAGLWILAAAVPPAVAFSLPSVFPIGAIALLGLFKLLRRHTAATAIAYGGFLTATGLSVATLAAMGQYRMLPADRRYFLRFWAQAFPPSWREPGALAQWLFRANTGPLFAFPHGAEARLAWLTPVIFGCFALGILLLSRKNRSTVALLVLPILLTLAASAVKRYPYGMSARVGLALVPSIVLLAALGAAWLCSRAGKVRAGRWLIPTLGVMLAVLGSCRLADDLGHPYRTPWDRTAREFARWFWEEMPADAEVVCVRSDLGIPFRDRQWAYDGADQYLCYQRIYSRRHRERRAPNWEAISQKRPLRCVLLNRMPEEVSGFQKWIDEHRSHYLLKEVRTYPATRGSMVEPALSYVVCEFVPTSRSSVDLVDQDGAMLLDGLADQESNASGRAGVGQ
jgi:hypothetical protein